MNFESEKNVAISPESEKISRPVSINKQIQQHTEELQKIRDARAKIKLMQEEYEIPETALADQKMVYTAHLPTEEHEKALEALTIEKKKQNSHRLNMLKSILNIFKIG